MDYASIVKDLCEEAGSVTRAAHLLGVTAASLHNWKKINPQEPSEPAKRLLILYATNRSGFWALMRRTLTPAPGAVPEQGGEGEV